MKIQIINNSIINIRQLDNSTTSLGRVRIMLQIGKIVRCVEAHVIRNLTTNLLLGLDNSQFFNLNLDLNNNCLRQDGQIMNGQCYSKNQYFCGVNNNQSEYRINENLDEHQRNRLLKMINGYNDVFAQSKSDVGRIV